MGLGFYVMVMDCSHSADLVLLYGSTRSVHMNTNSHLIAEELVFMGIRHVLTMRFFVPHLLGHEMPDRQNVCTKSENVGFFLHACVYVCV